MTLVRRAVERDIAVLDNIREDAIRTAPVDARHSRGGHDIARLIDNPDVRVLVAEVDGAIGGWGMIFRSSETLALVFVDPERADRTVRDAIVGRLERLARKDGVESLPVLTY